RPVVRLSAAGEGAFTVTQQNPQPLFLTKCEFFAKKFKVCLFSVSWSEKFVRVPRFFGVLEGLWNDSPKRFHKM
ncbi:hypothetical protein VK792_08840, partial [Mesobacterium sp. TK19101]